MALVSRVLRERMGLHRERVLDVARVDRGDGPGTVAFAVASIVGFGMALLPGDIDHPEFLVVGVVLAVATVALSPPFVSRAYPRFVVARIIGYYAATCLFLLGDSGNNEGLLAVVAIPLVWSALYQSGRVTVVALLAAVATLVTNVVVQRLDLFDAIQLLTVWPATGAGIMFAIYTMRRRLEGMLIQREHALQQNAVLSITADELYSSLDSDEVLELALQSAARLIKRPDGGDARALFFLVGGNRATLVASYSTALREDDRVDPLIDQLSFSLEAIPELISVLDRHEDRVLELTPKTGGLPPDIEEALARLKIERAIAYPVRVGDLDTGIIAVVGGTPVPGYSDEQKDWLRQLAAILELALSRALLHEAQTATDPLTNLANRREFERRLYTMPRRARYALLAIDVDHLKETNDTFGHSAGDELLRAVGDALRHSIRRGDVAARTGGDEFCVILPEADARRVQSVARRIMAELKLVTVRDRHPSVSIGAAGFTSGDDPTKRLAAADEALYQAKHAGGDRCVYFKRSGPPAVLHPGHIEVTGRRDE